MERERLRELVTEILRENPQTHLHAVIGEIKRRCSDYQSYDALVVQEIMWELLLQGVLAPGKNSLNLNLPFIHVTEYGERMLAEEALVHDPSGYIEKLEADIGGALPPVIAVYLRESLLTFLAGREFAAMVLLGIAASECLRTLPLSLPSGIAAISDRLVVHGLPAHEADALVVAVTGLRKIANYCVDQTGRPTAHPVTREVAHAHLLLFFDHCSRILAARARLQ